MLNAEFINTQVKTEGGNYVNKLLWFFLIFYPWVFNPFGKELIDNIVSLFSPEIVDISSGYYFRIPKAFFLITIAVLIGVRMLRDGNLSWKKQYDIPLLIYFGLILISTLFSEDKLNALFGFDGRFEGMFTFVIYFILYIAARNYFTINKKYLLFLGISISLSSIYGLLQYYRLDPLINNYGETFQGQAFSTIGNRNFFALYLCMYVPFAIGQFLRKASILNFLFALLPSAAIVASVTRGTWIGLGVTLVVGIILGWKHIQHWLRLGIIFLGVGASIYLMYYKGTAVRTKVAYFQVVETNNGRYDAGSGRVQIYKMSWEIIKAHPLLGIGAENMRQTLSTEFKPLHDDWVAKKKTTLDRAHSDYIHIAVSFGIPALAIFLWFLFQHYKNLYSLRKYDTAFVLMLGLFAFHLSILFSISIISVTPIAWILLGFSSQFGKKKLEFSDEE